MIADHPLAKLAHLRCAAPALGELAELDLSLVDAVRMIEELLIAGVGLSLRRRRRGRHERSANDCH